MTADAPSCGSVHWVAPVRHALRKDPVAAGGGLEDFLRKLEAAQRELQLPVLDAAEARQRDRQRRNVVKRPGVSYERGDDDAVGLRGPGAGSDDADQDSLQGFDEPSLSDNEASDEAAILRELEEINSGSDTVKRGTKSSKRNKRHRNWTARDYGETYKETETSKELQTPSEEQYGVESMSEHDLTSPQSGRPTLRMRGLNGNTTAGSSASENLLDGMQRTRKNVLLEDRYSSGMESYPRNMQRSLLDSESEVERADSHEDTFQQKSSRKAENMQSSDTSSQIDNEDDTLQGYNFRNLENELESDMRRSSRNGAAIRRDHKITPHQRNSLVYRQKLGQMKNGIQPGYKTPFSDKGVKVHQNERIEKNNFGGRDTERKKLTGVKLVRWKELNNNDDDDSYSSGGGRWISYTDRRPEGKVYRNNNERRTLMEKAPASKNERGIVHEQNSKYRKHARFRYSSAPVANYDSKKQRKVVTKTKEPFNREKYSMVRQPHSGKSRSRSSVKQKHSLQHLGGNDIASAATKEQLILEDSPGNFDLFDMGHSSRQRSSAKSPKDDDSFHFLWDSQFEDQDHHHHAPSNKSKKDHEEMHKVEITEKKEENSSITAHNHSVQGIEGQTKHEAHEDPAMEDIHSGKTIIGVMDEVMRQVERSHLVNKHLGPFLARDHAAEAEAHGPPEEGAECGGRPCPSALLSKLTDAVAEIVSSEVRAARCEPMSKRLHCFLTWLLQGAAEQFRPKNPSYVDPKRLAFYAAYYEEAGLVPLPPPPKHHPPKATTESNEGAYPCGVHKEEKGTCAASKQLHEEEARGGGEGGGGGGGGGERRGEGEEDNERERQIRLLKQLLKEYHTLSSREQTRLHSVHQYLEQQLVALKTATTPFPSAAHLTIPPIQIGAKEEGVAEELATLRPEGGSPVEPSLVEKTTKPPPQESPLEPEQASILPQETAVEQQVQVVEQESAPVMAEDFNAAEVAGEASAAGEAAVEATAGEAPAEAAIGEAVGEATAGEAAAEAVAGEAVGEATAGEAVAEAVEGEAPGEATAGETAAETVVEEAAAETATSHEQEVEQMEAQEMLVPTVTETEDELIEKDLELLGLGNSSNFGTKFNLAPLGHHRGEAQQPNEEEEEENPEAEGRARSRMQKRAAAAPAALNATEHTPRPGRNASDATTKPAAPQPAEKSMSPQPPLAEHSLTDPEEHYVVLPLLDNADALQRRRRRR